MQANGPHISGLTATQSSPQTLFTIPVLIPFTEYTCRLSSINIVGEGPATQHTFQTPQDSKLICICNFLYLNLIGPDDAPQNFTTITTKTNVTFNWRHPAIPNGIVTQYKLVIVVLLDNGLFRRTTKIISVSPNQQAESITINGFSPYQNYTATVSATTVVGYGPSATTNGRTDPDSKNVSFTIPFTYISLVSSEPVLIVIPVIISNIFVANTIPVVNDTAVNLTWSPPNTPNGYISSYNIDITSGVIMSLTVTADLHLNIYTQIIGGLSKPIASQSSKCIVSTGPGVPYYISIGAVNELGEGNVTSVTVFTEAESKCKLFM